MNSTLKAVVLRCVPKPIQEIRRRSVFVAELEANLFTPLPAATKHSFIRHAQAALNYPTFIETGTYRGDTSAMASGLFEQVHTIELDSGFAARARERFAGTNVTVHQGESAQVLRGLLPRIETPCLFWLDAHYIGGPDAKPEENCPLLEELAAIAAHPVRPHAVLIDDIRLFGPNRVYPTVEETFQALRKIDPAFHIGVACDIIWASSLPILQFHWEKAESGWVVPADTARVSGQSSVVSRQSSVG